MRDNGRIRSLPACLEPKKAKCEDYTVGDSQIVTVCEGLVKRKCKFMIAEILHLQVVYHFWFSFSMHVCAVFKRNQYGPCYDPAKNSCPSS